MTVKRGGRYAGTYHTGRVALMTDQVLTSGQLLRLGSDPGQFPSLTESVRVTSDLNSEREVTFHALDAFTLRRLDARQLGHLAGVAEIRMELGVPPGPHWSSRGQLIGETAKPDAVWRSLEVENMIEFDSCDYPRRVVREKLERFIPLGPVYWGMSSALRVERWSGYYPKVHFLFTPWWEGPEERAHTLAGGAGGMRGVRAARLLERTARRYRSSLN